MRHTRELEGVMKAGRHSTTILTNGTPPYALSLLAQTERRACGVDSFSLDQPSPSSTSSVRVVGLLLHQPLVPSFQHTRPLLFLPFSSFSSSLHP